MSDDKGNIKRSRVDEPDDNTLSDSSPSSSSSSSDRRKGFSFNGAIYPTYQEMVDAKRERNRLVLERCSLQVKEALGIDPPPTQPKIGKRKKFGNHDDVSIQSLRRSPRRTNSNGGSLSNASLSSMSHHSSKKLSKEDPVRPDASVKDEQMIDAGTEKNKEAKNQDDEDGVESDCASSITSFTSAVSLGTTASQEAPKRRKRLASTYAPGPKSTPGRAPRSIIHNYNKNKMEYPFDISLLPSGRKRGDHATDLLPRSSVRDFSAVLELVVMNGYRSCVREHVWRDFYSAGILEAGVPSAADVGTEGSSAPSVKAGNKHENELYDNYHAPGNDRLDQEHKGTSIDKQPAGVHAGDWKLYRHLVDGSLKQSSHSINGVYDGQYDDIHDPISMDAIENSDGDDSDEELIPKEFLADKNESDDCEKHDKLRKAEDKNPVQYKHRTVALPHDDTVKRNNIIRQKHKYYTSQGPDCDWDEEFGDGFDPMTFVEETCQKIGGVESDCSGFGCDSPNVQSFEARKYTSALLQRCWERAVHSASSTITLSPADSDYNGLNVDQAGSCKTEEAPVKGVREKILEELKKLKKSNPKKRTVSEMSNKEPINENVAADADDNTETNALFQKQQIINTALHNEAINALESVLDALFEEKSFLRQVLNRSHSDAAQEPTVDWRTILYCLQEAVGSKDCDKSGKIQINRESLKALSIRLMDRYSGISHLPV